MEHFTAATTRADTEPKSSDERVAEERGAARRDRFVQDFVLRRLLKQLTPRELEEFTIDFL